MASSEVLKNRLVELGLKASFGSGQDDDNITYDAKVTQGILQTLLRRLDRELKFYLEFTVTEFSFWRAGYAVESQLDPMCVNEYPGSQEWSFGFCSTGKIVYCGKEYE